LVDFGSARILLAWDATFALVCRVFFVITAYSFPARVG
jgi:hypothetical protein